MSGGSYAAFRMKVRGKTDSCPSEMFHVILALPSTMSRLRIWGSAGNYHCQRMILSADDRHYEDRYWASALTSDRVFSLCLV